MDTNAKLAGHSNSKQKIHYLESLKNENAALKKQISDFQVPVKFNHKD